jgi:hypothetical protein
MLFNDAKFVQHRISFEDNNGQFHGIGMEGSSSDIFQESVQYCFRTI